MLTLILNSYKLFFKQFKNIIILALPLLVLSVANLYFQPASKIIYCAYAIMLIIPFVSVATDISIYRKLFQYNIINPLCNISTFIIYLLAQIVIGLIGTAPIYLFQYLLLLLGLPVFWSLVVAVMINIPTGFILLARLNIALPLIIQNKIPSPKEFLKYTTQPYRQWLMVAVLIYLPYVILHYLSAPYPYTNIITTTLFMYVFICFNINYVNSNRLNRIPYKPVEVLVKEAEEIISEKEKIKPIEKPKKKDASPKTPNKKTAPKKASKPKLKSATV